MRATRFCLALLGLALGQVALAQDGNLERLTHCFDRTKIHAELRDHGTANGKSRQVGIVDGVAQLAVSDGYELWFNTAANTRVIAKLLLEQVPLDQVDANKKTMRANLVYIARNGGRVQLSARKVGGLDVLALDRTQVGPDHIVSMYAVFDDASGVMATVKMLGQDLHHPSFQSIEEWQSFRAGLLGRLGACMQHQAGQLPAPMPVAPPAAAE